MSDLLQRETQLEEVDYYFRPDVKSSGYRECSVCVMDTSDPEIVFDDTGQCNHCLRAKSILARLGTMRAQGVLDCEALFQDVKKDGRSRQYDAVVGLSGGADSSYLVYLAKQKGLRILAVHLDNGWNSELAVKNIHAIVDSLSIDLHTHVIDWSEFRDLQLSFMKANVIDIEMLTDHAIWACLYKTAVKYSIRHILLGTNRATESILPKAWGHCKWDGVNISDIHQKHGALRRVNTYPMISSSSIELYYTRMKGICRSAPLNYIQYDKESAMNELTHEIKWQAYKAKHYESSFTRFYQAYILPKKFGVDKRRAHLSSLIVAGAIQRSDALRLLSEPLYRADELRQHVEFVQRKFGMTSSEFDDWLAERPRAHSEYRTEENHVRLVRRLKTFVRTFRKPSARLQG